MAGVACAEWHLHDGHRGQHALPPAAAFGCAGAGAWAGSERGEVLHGGNDPELVLAAWRGGMPQLWPELTGRDGDDPWHDLLLASGRDPGWVQM